MSYLQNRNQNNEEITEIEFTKLVTLGKQVRLV